MKKNGPILLDRGQYMRVKDGIESQLRKTGAQDPNLFMLCVDANN
jgi:hypothetical protein